MTQQIEKTIIIRRDTDVEEYNDFLQAQNLNFFDLLFPGSWLF